MAGPAFETTFRQRGSGEAWKFRLGTNEVGIYDMLSEEDLVGIGPPFKNPDSFTRFTKRSLSLMRTLGFG